MPGVTQGHLGLTRGATSGPGGHLARPGPWPRPQGAWGPQGSQPGKSSSSSFLCLQKHKFCTLFLCSCCSSSRFSISLYDPSFELRFWANTPWYVTPSPLQLDF